MVEEGGEERLNCHEIDWKNDLQGGETEQKGLKSMKIIGWGGVAVVSVQKMMMQGWSKNEYKIKGNDCKGKSNSAQTTKIQALLALFYHLYFIL